MSASIRAQILDESLEIIAGLCTGEPFSYSGRHYRVEEMTFQPTPVQKPRFPIWIGGGWPNPGVKRRALRKLLGVMRMVRGSCAGEPGIRHTFRLESAGG